MQPKIDSVVQTLLQENANLTLQNAQYKSVLEQYENRFGAQIAEEQAKEEEK
ncbi:hypothetical protein [Leuconostoc pseudomesenteroides]|uniref:hypothetical protein n=1 Tax=Leuconostoc pseudomesenteroides TaxID=33968 RepID=UPI0039E951FB